jgi:phage regulator Rha-like protein
VRADSSHSPFFYLSINYDKNKNMASKLTKIQSLIYDIRGQKVMLDRDLAKLYGVEVKRLNEAIKRNIKRFPSDFMFQLTKSEWNILRSQIATSKGSRDGRRYAPYVFTEHGVLMLSNVLNSTKAISMSIQIIRVFDKLRKYALEQTSKDIRIEELHRLLMLHIENNDYKFSEYDKTIKQIINALNSLIAEPPKTKTIGFNAAKK